MRDQNRSLFARFDMAHRGGWRPLSAFMLGPLDTRWALPSQYRSESSSASVGDNKNTRALLWVYGHYSPTG